MPNINFGLGGAGIGAGGFWANNGGTATIAAGNLPGQLSMPIFDHDMTVENITTVMTGNNADQGVLSFPRKGHVKMTTDYRVYPEVLVILQGSTLTIASTTPTRTYKLRMKAGVLRPTFAYAVWAPDMTNPNTPVSNPDLLWGAFNCIMTKDVDIKAESFKPDTKLPLEFDVYPDATNQEFVIQASHETGIVFSVAGQPQLP